ncbi:MAG: Nif3-like dinuclear metal center hexameric protein, partial [Staphylococcus epidermidis]
YYKVQTFIPKNHIEDFKDSLNELGLAKEGNYEYCFFESEGKGQFKPVGDANPYIGKLDSIEYVDEIKLEFMIKSNELEIAKRAILDNHPYETPVFDFIKMNKESEYGLGIIGQLNQTMTLDEFSEYAKKQLNIIGGSGIGFEYKASQLGADVFVTGDIKHHDALDAKIQNVNLLDINHYSEYVMKEGLKELLEKWLFKYENQFPIYASEINTDPFKYK